MAVNRGGSPNRAARIVTRSIPAPIGGLNTLDSIAEMPPTDAITLTNFFPGPSAVPLRNGYAAWGSGITGNVETLAPYNSGSQSRLFAVAGGSLYDVTNNAAVGAALVTGLTNSRWQFCNFGNEGGQYLMMVNGADTPLIFDGTTWHRVRNATVQTISSITASGTTATLTTAAAHGLSVGDQITISGATPTAYNGTFTLTAVTSTTMTFTTLTAPGGSATTVGIYVILWNITGVTPSSFTNVNSWGSRLWFTAANSLTSWYLGISSVSGAATAFDLTAEMSLGGYLQGITPWNIDNSAGLNEYICFVSSQGEVAVYIGSDPAQQYTFSISAKFRIGPPVGWRFYEKFGSDVIFITSDGLVPLSKALLTDREQKGITLTEKILPSINADVVTYGGNFGWQPILFPDGNKVLLNVPSGADSTSYQYVMNTITNAWCKFTGWNAFCFAYFNKSLYFGGANLVAQADVNNDDNGTAINGDFQPAFNYFEMRGIIKHFKAIRPIFLTQYPFSITYTLNVDFSSLLPASTPSVALNLSTPWNTTPWDEDPWAQAQLVQAAWASANGIGYAATYRMQTQTKGIAFSVQSTDILYEPQKTPTF